MVEIFGLGFTGTRLARLLLKGQLLGRPQDGQNGVFAAVRDVSRFADLAREGLILSELVLSGQPRLYPALPSNRTLVLLIPPLPEPANAALHETIEALAPKRIVYVSSTGVYGDEPDVDDRTQPHPNDERGRLRLAEEAWISSGPWASLVLRAAAIYGPGRGVHTAIRQGKLPRGTSSGIVSRIHVDDLARLIAAGIESNVCGAYPVGDETPCQTAEIIQWCVENLDIPVQPPSSPVITIQAGRRVDGAKIRSLLGVELLYPDWQTGVRASIAEENSRQAARGEAIDKTLT